jgi:hypothetical protein
MCLNFGVTIINLKGAGPLRPWVIWCTSSWRALKKLEVDDGRGSMTNGGADAIITGVTTPNNDNLLAFGRNIIAILQV